MCKCELSAEGDSRWVVWTGHVRGKLLSQALVALVSVSSAQAQQYEPAQEFLSEDHAQAEAARIEAYWTPERMASAKAMPIGTVVQQEAPEPVPESAEIYGPPGFSPGWAPGSGPQPEPYEEYEITPGDLLHSGAIGRRIPQHGPKPSDPLNGPYGPFQRWTWFGRYLTYPTSAHGKLFFSLNGGNFVCSATVIQTGTVITAGHCNSDGNGTFATNRLFCPSYNANGVNPAVGCWAAVGSVVSGTWHSNGDPDYDYACLLTATTGTVINNRIGNVTGWFGRAWNWPSYQAIMAFGYPQGAPFVGVHIITAATTEWYTHDFTSGGQISKLVGSDMTGGSSGGSWVMGLAHRFAEYPDTDGSQVTDPGSFQFPWVNGVNSHKRCVVSCQSPPTSTNGVFWQEMSSPPFLDGAGSDDMKDVTDLCFNNQL